MSKRNALLLVIAVVAAVAAIFLWPERARADFSVSARIGGGFGGHHGGLHGSGYHGGIKGGHGGGLRGGFRGGRSFGGHDAGRHGSFGHHRGHSKRGLLLGDRYRLKTLRHVGRAHGGSPGHKGYQGARRSGGSDFRFVTAIGDGQFQARREPLLGDVFRGHTIRNVLNENRRDRHRDGRHGRHNRDSDSRELGSYYLVGREFRVTAFHRRGSHGHRGRLAGKWLSPGPAVLSYDDPDVIVREIIVPVPLPAAPPPAAAAEPPVVLDPRGRVTVVGEEQGIVGDWAQGDVLPRGVPLVTLDRVAYNLPEPPVGEKYARVGNDVLRIDAGSRRITEIVAR